MADLALYNKEGKEIGKVSGEDAVFSAAYSQALIHQTLRWYQCGLRQGTHSTLTKGEVRGGGKKPWKQKGTGRARAGSIRSPLWRGGGVIFGPKPRDYSFALPKKIRKAALRAVISSRAKEGCVKVIEGLSVSLPKTKAMREILKSLELAGKKTLLILGGNDKNLKLAGRNIPKLKIIQVEGLNIYDLLNCDWVVLQKEALPGFMEALS